jgi:hypothetical protein
MAERGWNLLCNTADVKLYWLLWGEYFTNVKHTGKLWKWLSSGMLRPVVWNKLTDVSELLTSVNFYETTRRNTPRDRNFHIRRRENF